MADTRRLSRNKRIALVAHDKKKTDLMDWAVHNRKMLAEHDLIATGTTGKMLEDKLGLPVKKLLSGVARKSQQSSSSSSIM